MVTSQTAFGFGDFLNNHHSCRVRKTLACYSPVAREHNSPGYLEKVGFVWAYSSRELEPITPGGAEASARCGSWSRKLRAQVHPQLVGAGIGVESKPKARLQWPTSSWYPWFQMSGLAGWDKQR